MSTASNNKLLKKSISVETAKRRTKNWREAVKVLFKDDLKAVPKGFMIPMEDITKLAENYKDYGIAGVRAYFSFENEKFEGGVTAVLVPVVLQKGPNNEDIYKDLIIEHSHDDGDNTSIYDFTKPCPDSCDVASPLFS